MTLPITADEMLSMVDEFLVENGFPVDNEHREYVGAYISTIDQWTDYFSPVSALAFVRRTIAGELAFALLVAPAQKERQDKARAAFEAKQAAQLAAAPGSLETKA